MPQFAPRKSPMMQGCPMVQTFGCAAPAASLSVPVMTLPMFRAWLGFAKGTSTLELTPTSMLPWPVPRFTDPTSCPITVLFCPVVSPPALPHPDAHQPAPDPTNVFPRPVVLLNPACEPTNTFFW